jgi:polygalacturonase
MHFRIMVILTWVCCITAAHAQTYNILDYHAVPDGKTANTQMIQRAVDDCAGHGGGTVLVPAGVFATGMIVLKSRVELHLNAGAVLQAIAGQSKYLSLVLIDQAEQVSITGAGTLFGSGKSFTVQESFPNRPTVLYVRNSKHVSITNITLKHAAAWTLRLQGCEGVLIKGITIYSHANFNNDGIDIDSKDVIISDCNIDSSDDGICLKSEDPDKLCENITITNCLIASNCNFIKMGTGSVSGFKNITISNCVLRKASESPLHHWYTPATNFITDTITGISGIALEVVDGGQMDQVSISNISMVGVQTPIFIRLGSRKNPTGSLKNVIISNVVATSRSRMASTISAVNGFYIENVTLRDILIKSQGGGTAADAQKPVPESADAYPENRMFGWSLPAYGLYVRHVKNLTLDNVQLQLLNPDNRPAIWLDDVQQLNANALKIDQPAGNTKWLKQVNVSAVKITNTYLKK